MYLYNKLNLNRIFNFITIFFLFSKNINLKKKRFFILLTLKVFENNAKSIVEKSAMKPTFIFFSSLF